MKEKALYPLTTGISAAIANCRLYLAINIVCYLASYSSRRLSAEEDSSTSSLMRPEQRC